MKVRIASLLEGAAAARGTVVVIDVLRAFSTAAIALQRGAARIVMVASLEEALSLRAAGTVDLCVGERGGARPAGFDFGNSPDAMSTADLAGKRIALTTSNGTAGLDAAARAGATALYAGALVSAAATAAAIRAANPAEVTLVAIGKVVGPRTDEDELCALYLRSLLAGRRPDPVALQRLLETMLPPPDAGLLANGDYGARDRAIALSPDSVPVALPVRRIDGLLVVQREH
jgi:2-phosphosulfolactate phosphatase